MHTKITNTMRVIFLTGMLLIQPTAAMVDTSHAADFWHCVEKEQHLVEAVVTNKIELARKLLIDHADPNTRYKKKPILTVAARNKNADMIRLLLVAGANPNAKDKTGLTALHIAALMRTPACISMLLQHPRIDLNPLDDCNITPLEYLVFFAKEYLDVLNKTTHDSTHNLPAPLGACFAMLWRDKRVDRRYSEAILAQNPTLRKTLFAFLLPNNIKRANKKRT